MSEQILRAPTTTNTAINSASSYRQAILNNPAGISTRPSGSAGSTGSTRPSSTSSTFRQQSSTNSVLRDEKKLRKQMKHKPKRLASDRIPSKSCCGVFFYNIPRSSIMITVPGFIILAVGALLLATTNLNQSWIQGGTILIALVFLVVGGIWTLGGVIYWLALWCKYQPRKGQEYRWSRSQMTSTSSAYSPRVPSTPSGSANNLASGMAFSNPVFTFDEIPSKSRTGEPSVPNIND